VPKHPDLAWKNTKRHGHGEVIRSIRKRAGAARRPSILAERICVASMARAISEGSGQTTKKKNRRLFVTGIGR
jgi:hypothetical protein